MTKMEMMQTYRNFLKKAYTDLWNQDEWFDKAEEVENKMFEFGIESEEIAEVANEVEEEAMNL